MTVRLTKRTFDDAVALLARRDPQLGAVVERLGRPALRRRPGGYATLALLILEQQVSLASARAAFERLSAAAGELTPEKVGALPDKTFRDAGISRQKTGYIRHLGDCVTDGSLGVGQLARLDDDKVRSRLTRVKGIGPWTADVYLLTCLMRPDVWPVDDVALQAAAREVKGLALRPDADTLAGIGQQWRPWRSVAARILWHHYLNTVRRKVAKTPPA